MVALPPLAEQHRIVAKVDELMALCDKLEQEKQDREARRDRFVTATHYRLNNPEEATADASTNGDIRPHAHFFLRKDTFERLTSRPQDIKQLRQTILNLAVRGKLVNMGGKGSEPALPFPLVRLDSLVTIVRGSSPRPKGDPRYYNGPVPRLLIADITRDGKYVTPRLDSLTEVGAGLSRPMNKGSLVLAISGSYGIPAFLAVDACIHDGFIGFRSPSPKIDPEFLYLVILFARPYFDSVVKDSGLKNLTTTHLKELKVPCPTISHQKEIVHQVDGIMAFCQDLEVRNAAIELDRAKLLNAFVNVDPT